MNKSLDFYELYVRVRSSGSRTDPLSEIYLVDMSLVDSELGCYSLNINNDMVFKKLRDGLTSSDFCVSSID